MKRTAVYDMICVSLSAALISVLSQLAFPLPTGIPLTLQTFAVATAGYLLGMKNGVFTVLLYILLGALGAPVFSSFRGGLNALVAELTGGFIFGFIFLALLCGFGTRFSFRKHSALFAITFGYIGLILCHVCGILQASAISDSDFLSVFSVFSLPFLAKDIISVPLAYYFCRIISRTNKI